MGGIVKKIGKVAKKLAPIAAAVAPIALPGIGIGISGTLGTALSVASKGFSALNAFNAVRSGGGSGRDTEVVAAQRRQEALLAQQQAATNRDRQAVNEQEQELSKRLAAQKNAVLARRNSRNGLSFTGPTTKLKTQLGG